MRFCTLAIARIDLSEPGTVGVTASNGGHPLPRVVRTDGSVERLGAPGTLVGVTTEIAVEDRSAVLNPGDAVVIFTDGLIEARAPQRVWSPEDVDEALGQAQAGSGGSLQRLVDQLAAAALGDLELHPRDDIAILALRAR